MTKEEMLIKLKNNFDSITGGAGPTTVYASEAVHMFWSLYLAAMHESAGHHEMSEANYCGCILCNTLKELEND